MKKLRLSHSLLLLWSQGRYDEAVAYYLKKELPIRKEYEEGKKWHKIWEEEIKSKKQVKIGSGLYKFKNPLPEYKVEV